MSANYRLFGPLSGTRLYLSPREPCIHRGDLPGRRELPLERGFVSLGLVELELKLVDAGHEPLVPPLQLTDPGCPHSCTSLSCFGGRLLRYASPRPSWAPNWVRVRSRRFSSRSAVSFSRSPSSMGSEMRVQAQVWTT